MEREGLRHPVTRAARTTGRATFARFVTFFTFLCTVFTCCFFGVAGVTVVVAPRTCGPICATTVLDPVAVSGPALVAVPTAVFVYELPSAAVRACEHV